MNKPLLYSNIVSTVIAALLAVIAFRLTPPAAMSRAMDVNIVGSTKSLPITVDFAELRKTPLPVSVGAAPLPVTIAGASTDLPVIVTAAAKPSKPMEVKIVGASEALPVTVTNKIEAGLKVGGPIDVNIASVGYSTIYDGKLLVYLKDPLDIRGAVSVSNTVDVRGAVKLDTGYGALEVKVVNH